MLSVAAYAMLRFSVLSYGIQPRVTTGRERLKKMYASAIIISNGSQVSHDGMENICFQDCPPFQTNLPGDCAALQLLRKRNASQEAKVHRKLTRHYNVITAALELQGLYSAAWKIKTLACIPCEGKKKNGNGCQGRNVMGKVSSSWTFHGTAKMVVSAGSVMWANIKALSETNESW